MATAKQGAARQVKNKRVAKKLQDKGKEIVDQSLAAAADMEVTDAASWKGRGQRKPVKLLLPSGNVCLAFNPGLQAFVEQGMIPNSLMPIVEEALREGSGAPPEKLQDIASNPQVLKESLEMMNAVACYCVVDPKIHPVPPDGEERDENLFYVDEADLEDKTFLLQWVVGGTRDLEKFRAEQAASLVDVAAKPSDAPETK